MKDKQQSYFFNIGSSSLLVIFLVLCLVTFAILSLSSARSDYSFSEKMAAHKQEYYEASERAEIVVGRIDEVLYQVSDKIGLVSQSDSAGQSDTGEAFAAYLTEVGTALKGAQIEGISLQLEQLEADGMISFQVPAGEQQALVVTLQVKDCRENPYYYEIKAWKIMNTGDWQKEQPLNLMPVIE